MGDRANPRDAFDQVGPDRLQVVPNRGDEAQPCDGHSTTVGLCHRAQEYGPEVQTRLSLMLEPAGLFLDTASRPVPSGARGDVSGQATYAADSTGTASCVNAASTAQARPHSQAGGSL